MPNVQGQHLTLDQRATIEAEVEQVMLQGAYCKAAEIALSHKHDVSTKTVRNCRVRVEAAWRVACGKRDMNAERADFINRIRAAQRDMRVAGKDPHGLFLTEARVLGLMAPTQVHVETTAAPDTRDGREALLADLRALPRDIVLEALGQTAAEEGA